MVVKQLIDAIQGHRSPHEFTATISKELYNKLIDKTNGEIVVHGLDYEIVCDDQTSSMLIITLRRAL
jgi:hypothetical protein